MLTVIEECGRMDTMVGLFRGFMRAFSCSNQHDDDSGREKGWFFIDEIFEN